MSFLNHFQFRTTLLTWGFIVHIITLNLATLFAASGLTALWGIVIAFYAGPILLVMAHNSRTLAALMNNAADAEKKLQMTWLRKRFKKDLNAIAIAFCAAVILWVFTIIVFAIGGEALRGWLEMNSITPNHTPLWTLIITQAAMAIYLFNFAENTNVE